MFAPVYAGPTTEKSPGGPDEPWPGATVTPASGEPASGDMTFLGATPHSWPDAAPNTALADGEAFLDDGERSTRSAASDELRYSSPLRPRSLYVARRADTENRSRRRRGDAATTWIICDVRRSGRRVAATSRRRGDHLDHLRRPTVRQTGRGDVAATPRPPGSSATSDGQADGSRRRCGGDADGLRRDSATSASRARTSGVVTQETLPTGRRTPPSSRRDAPHARPLPPPPPRPPPPATAQPPSWVITCCYK